MTAPLVSPAIELRCFSCSHRIGDAPQPMRLAAAFKPSLVPEVAVIVGEQRRRCRSCGWVNVLVPAVPDPAVPSWRVVETKKAG